MSSLNNLGQEDLCYKIYDPVEKKLIAVYNTCREASDKLGLTQKTIRGAATSKTRRFSEKLNKEVAIRRASKNQN